MATNATFPAVASMSLGGGASAAVDAAIQGMIDAGVTVAVAAGNNDGNACNNSPARAENVSSYSQPLPAPPRSQFAYIYPGGHSTIWLYTRATTDFSNHP